jgi:hypothetical protein
MSRAARQCASADESPAKRQLKARLTKQQKPVVFALIIDFGLISCIEVLAVLF